MTDTPDIIDEMPEASVPKGNYSVLLSGLGFYKLSVQRRKALMYVFGSSLIIHIVGLLIFGGWIVMRSRPEEVTVFKTPPPTKTYEPRKLEHSVKLRKRQRSSSRPAMMPRMVSMKMSELALPEIKMNPKLIHTTFQPKFKAVSGKGLGAGLGTGYGSHGFGAGVSSFDFFGIRARGEKIAVLVDVSVSMVEEERGGVIGYMRVKQRIEQVIDALSEAALFNVIVFADSADALEEQMVIADNENKKKAKLYIRPYNTEGNWGLRTGNLGATGMGLRAGGGTTRLDLALAASFEQGADTILIISDGAPRVKGVHTEEQLRAYKEAEKTAQYVEERVFIAPQPARAARPPSNRARTGPPKEGQSFAVDRGSPAQAATPGRWTVRQRKIGGGHLPDPGYWTLNEFIKHLKVLHENMYLKKGKKPPVVHCIGYQIDKQGHAFLQRLAKTYRGRYRRVHKLK